MNSLFPELENHYIGITETYDPCFDFSWKNNREIANIIITKRLSLDMIDALLECKDNCILHAVCTGYGNTVIEPAVQSMFDFYCNLEKLINLGFPKEQVVLRISPIFPTKHGIKKVLEVLDMFASLNIKRIRFSTLNMYNHVKTRFIENNVPIPYETYSCPKYMRDDLIQALSSYYNITDVDDFNLDCCGEIDLDEMKIKRVGCVSQKDLDILGVSDKVDLFGIAKQRKTCLCPNNKKQIIRRKPGRCPHNCIYCYWKD